MPSCHYRECQNVTTNTIEYLNNHSQNTYTFNGLLSDRNPDTFDWSILEKQIIKSCNKLKITDYGAYLDIIKYYYKSYMDTFHEEHQRLSAKAMDSVVRAITFGTDVIKDIDIGIYHNMIDKHFQTQYSDCDYNICHFMTQGVRNNRFYETCY